MITGLIFVSVLSMLVLGLLSASVDSSRWTSREEDRISVESSAESAMSLAIESLWSDFQRQMSGSKVTIWDFQAYLDGRQITDQSEAAAPQPTNLIPQLGLPVDEKGNVILGDQAIEALTVNRIDDINTTRLEIVARIRSRRRANTGKDNHVTTDTVRATWKVEAADWDGLEYAMLANNVNCILCHTEIDNAQRVYNDNPDLYGSFSRVKLGSIESFVLRENPHTNVAGSIYLGGQATDIQGNPLGSWGSLSLKSKQFDSQGKLQQDAWGDLISANLSPASATDPAPFENLYLDYLNPAIEQVDGLLPESFPSPFPDDGGFDFATGKPDPNAVGNRIVDDAEFAAIAKAARGSLTGGIISVIPPGQKVNGNAGLADLKAGNEVSLSGSVTGNVYLHGTKDNPIIINGPLAVDGDLIISGYVKGLGTLNVRDNVYVLDDVKYVDHEQNGTRKFGFASDGTENALAIASGGNISIGDIFRPSFGTGSPVTGSTNGGFSFILEEMSVFNRMEWMKTQPTLPGKAAYVKVGTKTYKKKVQPKKKIKVQKKKKTYKKVKTGTKKVAKYKWVKVTSGSGPYATSKWVKQFNGWKTVNTYKKVFNGWKTVWKWKWVNDGPAVWVNKTKDIMAWQTPQVPNPHYKGADYIPRYYSFSESGKVPIFNKDGYYDSGSQSWHSNSLISGGWSTSKLTLANPQDPGDPILYGGNGQPKAVISSIMASDGWMSDQMLKKLIQDTLAQRDPGPIEIDATVYSNNSIFGIVPDRASPTTNGELILNGGIVAADVGLLAPNGTHINYDERGKDLIQVNDDSRLKITRLLWAPTN